jgi:hypothetical protein
MLSLSLSESANELRSLSGFSLFSVAVVPPVVEDIFEEFVAVVSHSPFIHSVFSHGLSLVHVIVVLLSCAITSFCPAVVIPIYITKMHRKGATLLMAADFLLGSRLYMLYVRYH